MERPRRGRKRLIRARGNLLALARGVPRGLDRELIADAIGVRARTRTFGMAARAVRGPEAAMSQVRTSQ
jgi:hypothetical protein